MRKKRSGRAGGRRGRAGGKMGRAGGKWREGGRENGEGGREKEGGREGGISTVLCSGEGGRGADIPALLRAGRLGVLRPPSEGPPLGRPLLLAVARLGLFGLSLCPSSYVFLSNYFSIYRSVCLLTCLFIFLLSIFFIHRSI